MKPTIYNITFKFLVTIAFLFALWGVNMVAFTMLPTALSAVVFFFSVLGFGFGLAHTFRDINKATERMIEANKNR